MASQTIRELRGVEDARPQYELWLRATAALPRPWRSSLRNVEHQLENGLQYPKCRLYAEGPDGTLAGYIGTHPPFEWLAAQHGPPSRSMGWAIPFGFPWTDPLNASLQNELYDAMIRETPLIYADFRRDIYIQRFRESWSDHLAFLEQRGWRQLERIPLLGRQIRDAGAPANDLVPVTRADLQQISVLIDQDPTNLDALAAADLQRRYDDGWIVSDTFWRLGERGAFAIEQRGRWAGVTLLAALPAAWNETVHAAAAAADGLGASEMYFTVEPHETNRRDALARLGFHEVDAGVYYVRDAG